MKIITKVKKHGSSYYFHIPTQIVDELSIEDDVKAQIEILSVLKVTHNVCPVCEHQFETDDEYPYCPACGYEFKRFEDE